MSEKQNKIIDESEGSIQTVCGFNTKISIVNGEIKLGKEGKVYALLTVIDSKGEKHLVNSASSGILRKILEKMVFTGKIDCTIKDNPPFKDGKYNFFSLENI
tara:strand:+ start:2994 stop:3299 length:306 start_codon:yes stop_codon:yes gene_type:complete